MNAPDPFSLFSRRRIRTVYQGESAECGLACLAMVANFHGQDWTLSSLRLEHSTSSRGATLRTLVAIAEEMRFEASAIRIDPADVEELPMPAILHWDGKHFVVIESVDRRGRALIHDPAVGARIVSRPALSDHFSGFALVLKPAEDFTQRLAGPRLRFAHFWKSAVGLKRILGQVILISLVIQLLALILPIFVKVAVDSVALGTGDSLLLPLLAGFLGLALFHFLMTWFRDSYLLWASTSFSYELVSRLFRHLVHLNLSWFERRSVGDVVSRFQSHQPISDLITRTFAATLIDGMLAFSGLLVTYLYGGIIVLVPLMGVALILAVRFIALPKMKAQSLDSIQLSAQESSTFMETARGIATLKAFGEEGNRVRFWRSQKIAANNALIRMLSTRVLVDSSVSFLENAERIMFIFVGVLLVRNGTLTIGMLFALQAYKSQFVEALERTVVALVDYRMLDIHVQRLSDVVLSESKRFPALAVGTVPEGVLELRNVSFSYDRFQKPVLNDVNLRISKGETVAITGASGGGKTTLMKIALGLLEPCEGSVLIDGRPMTPASFASIRPYLASVLQDDVLYAGSLAQNIAFFDEFLDEEKVSDAAKAAAILEEIESMPMRFNTLVGDMGSTLSGGQKQRVLLARALYRNPRILLLDEGTAHLDVTTERRVNDSVRSLSITRLIVAHRLETVRTADRVFSLTNGRLEEIVCGEPIQLLAS